MRMPWCKSSRQRRSTVLHHSVYCFLAPLLWLFLSTMCLRYANISPSSPSLRSTSAKLGIRCSGQTRTERGSRISARKPVSVKYSVGFIGKFRSGPTDAGPARFIV
jgi:hypothetical protein